MSEWNIDRNPRSRHPPFHDCLLPLQLSLLNPPRHPLPRLREPPREIAHQEPRHARALGDQGQGVDGVTGVEGLVHGDGAAEGDAAVECDAVDAGAEEEASAKFGGNWNAAVGDRTGGDWSAVG